MMRELVFLLEEQSASAMLDGLLPRLLHPVIRHRCIPFEGKNDLEKRMVQKLRGYLNPLARFIVLRDLDNHPDCRTLKTGLVEKAKSAGKAHLTLIRIACRELESFYLADLQAVEQGLGIGKLVRRQKEVKFRTPDAFGFPSREMASLTGGLYQKVSGSRAIGPHLDLDNTRSASFACLIAGIRRLEAELLAIPCPPTPESP